MEAPKRKRVNDLSEQELAERSGTTVQQLRHLVELGIISAQFVDVVHTVAHQHGGLPVRLLGDGVMLHFPEPARGVLCGLARFWPVTKSSPHPTGRKVCVTGRSA